jgi:hypothetical protein
MIDSFHPSSFSLILNLLDLTRHSRQLLAESYLEAGVSGPQNWDAELDFLSQADPGVTFQHAPDEDNEHDGDDDDMEEVIYGFVFQFSLLSSMLT